MRKTEFVFRTLLATCWMWGMALSASAAEVAGVILTLAGKVEIVRGAEVRPAAIRSELLSGDTIATGEGQAQIRFSDGTLLTLYRDTRFAVDDYQYGKGKEDKASFSLLNGLMHTLTGQMNKDNYQLKTRLANLGVRGTEYSVQLGTALQVSVDQGRVAIANAGGTLEVGAGGSAIVTAANVAPRPGGSKIDLRGGGGPGGGRPGGQPPPGGGQAMGGGQPMPGPSGDAGGRPPPPGTQNFRPPPP